MNKVFLIGNLGADPELRDANGTPVTNMRIATSKKYTKKNGEKVDETQWHRITVFGAQAEPCAKYLSKGRQVAVEGEIQYREYEQDGAKKFSTDIIASHVEFLKGGDKQPGDSVPF